MINSLVSIHATATATNTRTLLFHGCCMPLHHHPTDRAAFANSLSIPLGSVDPAYRIDQATYTEALTCYSNMALTIVKFAPHWCVQPYNTVLQQS